MIQIRFRYLESISMKKSVTKYYSKQRRGPVCLWSNELVLGDRLTRLLAALYAPSGDGVDVLKESLRRCVLRVNNYSDDLSSFIIKGFPLKKFESRLKYHKYGLAEAYNYMRAQEFNLSIPKCYGYFEQSGLFGTVKANGALIEDLGGYATLDDQVQAFPEQRLPILNKAIPVMAQLFKTGVNHIDMSPHNLMESSDGDRVVLIDWQYCSFVAAEDVKQLVFQAAQFLRYTDLSEGGPGWSAWLWALYEACSPSIEWELFSQNVARVQSMKRASIKDRLSLTLDLCG